MTLSPTDYHVTALSGTYASMDASMDWLAAANRRAASPPKMPLAVLPTMTIRAWSGTIARFNNTFADVQPSKVDFEGTIATFYTVLLGKQQPLGKEFERVLHDNLWSLYVRS